MPAKKQTSSAPTTQKARSTKEQKIYDNLKKTALEFLTSKKYRPVTLSDISTKLGIHETHLHTFEEILVDLQNEKRITLVDGRYHPFQEEEISKEAIKQESKREEVTGYIHVHHRGFGFVTPEGESGGLQDIFIPKPFIKEAIDGDLVQVEVNPDSFSEKGPEGKVIAILKRERQSIAGIIRQIDRHGEYQIYSPLLGADREVVLMPPKEMKLRVGDRLVMKVLDWGSKDETVHGKFERYLGHITDPSCDISAAIEEYGIRSCFPEEALEEAEALGKQVSLKDIKGREDFRDLITLTIDPDTAKDFDDAISLTKGKDGTYCLGVHIADVSHYVFPGTALDEEAKKRCNSTYFPGKCVPMLPGELSENLCSLKPNVNRLTASVIMNFDSQGTLVSHRMTRSVIKSAKRLTYKEAKKILDGEKQSPFLENLQLMVELCRLLKRKRYERGSIEFGLPELVVLVDEKGMPSGTDYITYDITHQMIEEFMLKANEMVAFELAEKGKNLTYRVHEEPALDNLRDFSMLAAAFGFKVSDAPSPQDLQKLFEEAGSTAYSSYLATSYIRRMKMASYSPDNIGHYGLGLTHYCHFTSPIRRYVDLVVHRILFGGEDDLSYLKQISSHCSERERISAKAEGSVLQLKKLRLLNESYKKDPYQDYAAIITKVKPYGVYFEILDLLLEGFIHVSGLEEDYFVYEEERMRLKGSRTGSCYAPGDNISVILKEIDFISQETKWYITLNRHSDLVPVVLPKKKGKKEKDDRRNKKHNLKSKGKRKK